MKKYFVKEDSAGYYTVYRRDAEHGEVAIEAHPKKSDADEHCRLLNESVSNS